jgi:hypothetical protein
MGLVNEGLSLALGQAWQRNAQLHLEPKPCAMAPIPTVLSTEISGEMARVSRAATYFMVLKKHAAYPAANNCSGLVPRLPAPPSSLGVVSRTSSTPSDGTARPSRPPVAFTYAW